MKMLRASIFWCLALVCGYVNAAEVGVVTIVEGGARVLRGVTWYKLVPGTRVDEGDIFDAGERAQVHLEFASGSAVNFVGPGQLYLTPPSPPAKGSGAAATPTLILPGGWLKAAVKMPGLRIRTAAAEIVVSDGIVVLRALPLTLELFTETGSAHITELLPSGATAPMRDAKRGEYWAKTGATPFTIVPRAPKAFVDAMPRHFTDSLPNLVTKFKTKPQLAIEREISFAEAEPWLAGRDRSVFEKRFGIRLRDPVFRKAAEPNSSRYPMWDRILHPERYLPKPAPLKQ